MTPVISRRNPPRENRYGVGKEERRALSHTYLICLDCCQIFAIVTNTVMLLRKHSVCVHISVWVACWSCNIWHLSTSQGSYVEWRHPALNLWGESTHPQVCKSTLLFHFQDTHTPTCIQLCREASAKCPRFYKTSHFHGNDLWMTNVRVTFV